MRLTLHILKKDVRRLGWGIAIALTIQIAAAWFDAVGAIALPLELLLMVTWATLLTLAIQEDPLTGDRQFWLTRPARWRTLLGSKLLFALAVVHVPSLAADMAVLAVRGFHPWEWLASLASKQILLAAALTLPILALAAVLRNFAYLALAAAGIVGLTTFASTFTQTLGAPTLNGRWPGVDETRYGLMALAVGAGASVVVWRQFARRRTWRSRLVGMASVLAAETVLALFSPILLTRVRAALEPVHAQLLFHSRTPSLGDPTDAQGKLPQFRADQGFFGASVPVEVSGIPAGWKCLFSKPLVDVIAPGGERFQAHPILIERNWMLLEIPLRFMARLKDAKVELKGAIPVILYRLANSTSLPVGINRVVPSVGRCTSEILEVPDRNDGESHRSVHLMCESPRRSPLPATVMLRESIGIGRFAEFDLSAAEPLTPLLRADAYYQLGRDENLKGSDRLEITPELVGGWQVVNLDLRDIRIGEYIHMPFGR